MTAAEVRSWLSTDETAHSFFARVAAERPPLVTPPLHRLPLRPGNVLEIAGPSPSAKSLILLQVVVDCILPKEWNGVCYGGLELSVMFIDLDCRFDVVRLVQLLKFRVDSINRSGVERRQWSGDVNDCLCDEELVEKCLERFLYVRCYDSIEFLSTLKTLNSQLQTRQQHIPVVRFMMIDSIGAYYWVDRASTSFPLGSNNRKILSLQSVMEAVVLEIRNIMMVQPMLVIATKATIFGDSSTTNDVKRTFRKWSSHDASGQNTTEKGPVNTFHREYMPSAWQSFVTHRIFVRPSNSEQRSGNHSSAKEQVYLAQWLQPSLGFTDKFVVRDAGISMVS
ncbi:hypothetical protein vseg_021341 [Gypsophila vaccaria]